MVVARGAGKITALEHCELLPAAGELRSDGFCDSSPDSANLAPEKRMHIPFEAEFPQSIKCKISET